MGERKAVTKTMAKRYRVAGKTEKTTMLDELCALTGWTRDHALRALRIAATTGGATPERAPRPRIYDEDAAGPLRMIWATLDEEQIDLPLGKRSGPLPGAGPYP